MPTEATSCGGTRACQVVASAIVDVEEAARDVRSIRWSVAADDCRGWLPCSAPPPGNRRSSARRRRNSSSARISPSRRWSSSTARRRSAPTSTSGPRSPSGSVAPPSSVNVGFDGIIAALLSNKCDAIISGMNNTPERAEQVDFVDYLLVGQSLMVRKGNPLGHHFAGVPLRPRRGRAGRLDQPRHPERGQRGVPGVRQRADRRRRLPVGYRRRAGAQGRPDRRLRDRFAGGRLLYRPGPGVVRIRRTGHRRHSRSASPSARTTTELRDQVQEIIDEMYADGTMTQILEKWDLDRLRAVGKRRPRRRMAEDGVEDEDLLRVAGSQSLTRSVSISASVRWQSDDSARFRRRLVDARRAHRQLRTATSARALVTTVAIAVVAQTFGSRARADFGARRAVAATGSSAALAGGVRAGGARHAADRPDLLRLLRRQPLLRVQPLPARSRRSAAVASPARSSPASSPCRSTRAPT